MLKRLAFMIGIPCREYESAENRQVSDCVFNSKKQVKKTCRFSEKTFGKIWRIDLFCITFATLFKNEGTADSSIG